MQFKDVIGQNDLKQHLIQEILSDKISHAKLFLGEAGFGTLPIVLAYIQFLFCENKQSNDSCGKCNSCKKTAGIVHPDLHFSFPIILAEGKVSDEFLSEWRKKVLENPYFNLNQWSEFIDEKNRKPQIGSEESLAIIKKLSLKSFEGNFKVMVIWMASEMNTTCANKLLKIIEEPTPNTLIILIADNQENLLQTIISRTQLIRVPSIHVHELATEIQSKFNVEKTHSESIAAQSEGNFIETLSLLNENESKNLNRDFFIQLMRVCYKKEVNGMLDWAEEISSIGKEKHKNFLKYALHMFRQSLLKNYTDEQLIKVSSEELQFLKNFAKFITGNNIFDFMENFNDAYYHIDRNANPKLLFTDLCFKVMRYIHFA
jgi:DNA polymerase III subunit delta'